MTVQILLKHFDDVLADFSARIPEVGAFISSVDIIEFIWKENPSLGDSFKIKADIAMQGSYKIEPGTLVIDPNMVISYRGVPLITWERLKLQRC